MSTEPQNPAVCYDCRCLKMEGACPRCQYESFIHIIAEPQAWHSVRIGYIFNIGVMEYEVIGYKPSRIIATDDKALGEWYYCKYHDNKGERYTIAIEKGIMDRFNDRITNPPPPTKPNVEKTTLIGRKVVAFSYTRNRDTGAIYIEGFTLDDGRHVTSSDYFFVDEDPPSGITSLVDVLLIIPPVQGASTLKKGQG